ncbi:MAG: YqiA/YcfP family alpha/beta fold hydrolase [Candidatus Woesearchaeota archaeon]|nr:YqiA/YcfP family alpha/beta fold hydrolase [Candidatus Woesearchaeota archaeon]
MEEVTFSDLNGNQILGTISIPKQARMVVIISHGFSSSKETRLYVELQNELNKLGIGVLRYDYYGHGQHYCKGAKYTVTRDVTLSKCVDSLKAAISFVRSRGNYDIGLVGSSFGGLISLIAASQDSEMQALALKSPVTEPIDFWKQRLGDERIRKWKQEGVMHYNEHGENFELNYAFWEDLITYDTFKMAKNITCPVLIVHGGSDSVVPISESHNFARIVNTKVNVVEGANHDYANPSQYKEMKKLITDFFVEKLSL